MTDISDFKKTVITLTGPSGSGKTVLSKLLQDQGFQVLVSVTTRDKRQGEVEGVDYHFIDRARFAEMLESGRMIEHTEYNGTLYGVTADEAELAFSLGKPAVVVVEPHGKDQIKDICGSMGWSIIRAFVDNDAELLYRRLLNRLLLDVSHDPLKRVDGESVATAVTSIMAVDQSHPQAQATMAAVLREFLEGNGLSPYGEQALPQVTASAKRLCAFQFEQDQWVKPARNDPSNYEVVFPRFDADVQDAVVATLVDMAAAREPITRTRHNP